MKKEVIEYWERCKGPVYIPRISKPCKILVTYDSFRHVREALGEDIKYFYVVVDEFQAILGDSRFKACTELELLYQLKSINYVCYVSATPMLDKYLSMLEEFRDLPYFELDWESEDSNRVIKPVINVKIISDNKSVEAEAGNVIQKYLDGKFEVFRSTEEGKLLEISSNEAVLYVNSVASIAKLINKFKLTPLNTNVLCAKTEFNEKKILKAFKLTKKELKKLYGLESCLGDIPGKGEAHKMFTFCTRTVYLGADFYSKCAQTFIFSDANINCLSVDISMDLEQILGRQRLNENPWKNRANLFVKTNFQGITELEFKQQIDSKLERTKYLLKLYEKSDEGGERDTLVDSYETLVKVHNYVRDYLGINSHGGKNKFPTFNYLVLVSEMRAFELQRQDYKDRFSVFSTIQQEGIIVNGEDSVINHYLAEFNSKTTFIDTNSINIVITKILLILMHITFNLAKYKLGYINILT